MPFIYRKVYKLTALNDPFSTSIVIAMGVTVLNGEVRYFIPSLYNSERSLYGSVVKDEGEVVEVEASRVRTVDGSLIRWRFEPLTLEMWKGLESIVSGHATLAKSFHSDDDVQNFYLTDFLDE
jgi:hypothetical protein